MKLTEAEEQKIERFIENMEFIVDQLENYSGYLRLQPEGEEVRKKALKILRKKLKRIEDAETDKDLKSVLRVNKIIGRDKS